MIQECKNPIAAGNLKWIFADVVAKQLRRQIQLLNGSDTAVFVQEHAGLTNHRIHFIMHIIHGKLRILRTETDGTDTCFSKPYQLVVSICVFAPDEQFFKNLVGFINPAFSQRTSSYSPLLAS